MTGSTVSHGSGKWLMSLVRIACLAGVYYVAARLGLLLAFASTNATPVWPPSGIAMGALLLFGYRIWPGIFIGAFAANVAVFAANHVAGGVPTAAVSLAIASGNTLESLVGVFLLRQVVGRGGYFTQPINVYKFVLIAALAGGVSASIGTVSLLLGKIAPFSAQWVIASTWWLGDVAGILIVTPLLLAWRTVFSWQSMRQWSLSIKSIGPLLISLLALGLVLATIFGQQFSSEVASRSLAYLVLPCIGWAAYRYGRRGVTLVLLAVTGAAVWGTTHGLGPFARGTLQDSLAVLEIFIVLCSVVGLVLAADISERKRIQGNFSIEKHVMPLMHWAALFICLGLTIAAWHFISGGTERQAQDRFNYIADSLKQRIDERMDVYENLLHAGRGLFSASKSVEREEWRRFVERLNLERNFPGVQGVGYAKKIVLAEKNTIEQNVRTDGLPDFHIWPQGQRDEYVSIIYIEPASDRNRRVFGFDVLSESVRRNALLQARDSGAVAISKKLTLIQETGQEVQVGFLMFNPVYRNGASINTRDERIAALEGFVYSPFRMNNLMKGILGESLPQVALELFDGPDETDAALMYSSDQGTLHNRRDYPNAFTALKAISIVNNEQNWTLRITSLPSFETTIDRQKSLIVLIAGTLISLLFFGIVGSLNATREKAQTLANEMTAALKAKNLSLRQSEQELRLAMTQAESASRAKSEFVANMSHELRTPMNAVLGITYLLGGSELSVDQKKYLEMIRASGQSLLDILNDILDFSKIEAGRMELSLTQFHLGDVLNAIATIMSVNAGEKDLQLAIGVAADVPRMLIGDALRLQQILINLVGNAVKFTEQGEVSMLVDLDVNTNKSPHESNRQFDVVSLRFRVRDSGIGMNEEQQARLFSPFTQADSSMTRRFGGSGLGLTICRRLIDLMGGRIDMHSQLGAGSEFCATIPFQAAIDQQDPKRLPDAMHRLRILIVEDHQTTRDCLVRSAQTWDWQVDSAASGTHALECLRQAKALGQSYDAVVSDWDMPDMDGIGVMQSIRELLPDSSPPVILMVSAFGRGKLMNTPFASQADAMLIKPVTDCSLYDSLHEVLLGKSMAQQNSQTDSAAATHLLDGVRLLLAEDNAFNQIVAKGMLEQAGASVDIVENGQLALDLLRVAAHRYQLVLMDVQMPVMDGFTATRLIRRELQLTLPVLAMTAGVTESERLQCIDAGMDDFIAKPISVGQMFATILRHLPANKNAATMVEQEIAVQETVGQEIVGQELVIQEIDEQAPVKQSYDELPVFNVDPLLALAKKNPDYHVKLTGLIQRVVEKSGAAVDEARLAWDQGNVVDAAHRFHSMRGEIGTLGARRFVQITLDIEAAILANDGAKVKFLFPLADQGLHAVLSAARQWLSQYAIVPEPQESQSVALDLDQLQRLKILLAEKNMQACEIFTALRPGLRSRMGYEDIAVLDRLMDALDFERATSFLQKIFG